MPRYYFNLVRSGEILPDSEGVDAPDDAAARRAAGDVIEEFRTLLSSQEREWEGWQLEIVDETGRVVAIIPLPKDCS
ncbi:DUF6894 family protein [Microvirga roseola]|uniref:DUF6894 family protein n=1 Tax=Microvirga roseola TaxID=2883126 RepID=UPI001E5FAD15|nr:hypothetical protein [Microvirga roseola]